MSNWFTGFAGKAEDILNKLDQNAASVLQQKIEQDDHQLLMESSFENNGAQTNKNHNETTNNNKSIMILSKPSPNISPTRKQKETYSDKQNSSSNLSASRRSSLSSRAEGTIIENIIERNISQSITNSNIGIENELAAVKIVLTEIKSERDELKSELENLAEQLKCASNQSRVMELEAVCDHLSSERESLVEKNFVLNNSNTKYIKSISELETTISKLHQTELELSEKLQWAKSESHQAISELQQYRSRAQNTLLDKEKIIAQLSQSMSSDSEHGSTQLHADNSELEQLKVENDYLNGLVNSFKTQIDQIKLYNTKIEEKHREYSDTVEEKLNIMQENLKVEKRRCRQYEDDIRTQNQEMATVREEMIRIRSSTSKNIHEKEIELTKLRNKLSQRSELTISSDLEEKLHSLTQSLVQKQTSLESMTAERNAKKLQLEKLENQHRNAMMQIRQHIPQIINVNDTDDAKAEVPNFLQENPFDTSVARRVKRAYSSLDSVSVRLGVFLRRFPLIRIFIIIYVFLLHLWVMVVLLSSTPN